MGDRPAVFISYARADKEWKDRLMKHLGVLERQGLLDVWDDSRIKGGEEWKAEIERAINRAKVAVLIITADYLNSDFILDEEVPRLLRRRKEEGLRIIPILAESCDCEYVDWLVAMLRADEAPLSAGTNYEINKSLADVAKVVRHALGHRRGALADLAFAAKTQPRIPLSFVGAITSTVVVVQLSGGSLILLIMAVGTTVVFMMLTWAVVLYAFAKGSIAAVGSGIFSATIKTVGAGFTTWTTIAGTGFTIAFSSGVGIAGTEVTAKVLGEPSPVSKASLSRPKKAQVPPIETSMSNLKEAPQPVPFGEVSVPLPEASSIKLPGAIPPSSYPPNGAPTASISPSGPTSESKRPCVPRGYKCDATVQCCNGFICESDHRCGGCVRSGFPCSSLLGCCAHCVNGTCADWTACGGGASTCDDNRDCCTPLVCIQGKCSPCTTINSACINWYECCGNASCLLGICTKL